MRVPEQRFRPLHRHDANRRERAGVFVSTQHMDALGASQVKRGAKVLERHRRASVRVLVLEAKRRSSQAADVAQPCGRLGLRPMQRPSCGAHVAAVVAVAADANHVALAGDGVEQRRDGFLLLRRAPAAAAARHQFEPVEAAQLRQGIGAPPPIDAKRPGQRIVHLEAVPASGIRRELPPQRGVAEHAARLARLQRAPLIGRRQRAAAADEGRRRGEHVVGRRLAPIQGCAPGVGGERLDVARVKADRHPIAPPLDGVEAELRPGDPRPGAGNELQIRKSRFGVGWRIGLARREHGDQQLVGGRRGGQSPDEAAARWRGPRPPPRANAAPCGFARLDAVARLDPLRPWRTGQLGGVGEIVVVGFALDRCPRQAEIPANLEGVPGGNRNAVLDASLDWHQRLFRRIPRNQAQRRQAGAFEHEHAAVVIPAVGREAPSALLAGRNRRRGPAIPHGRREVPHPLLLLQGGAHVVAFHFALRPLQSHGGGKVVVDGTALGPAEHEAVRRGEILDHADPVRLSLLGEERDARLGGSEPRQTSDAVLLRPVHHIDVPDFACDAAVRQRRHAKMHCPVRRRLPSIPNGTRGSLSAAGDLPQRFCRFESGSQEVAGEASSCAVERFRSGEVVVGRGRRLGRR